jgi:hypothetical protein
LTYSGSLSLHRKTVGPKDPKFKYLNSGVFVGFADGIQKIMEDYNYRIPISGGDQMFWSKAWVAERANGGAARVCLDSQSQLFHTAAQTMIQNVSKNQAAGKAGIT